MTNTSTAYVSQASAPPEARSVKARLAYARDAAASLAFDDGASRSRSAPCSPI